MPVLFCARLKNVSNGLLDVLGLACIGVNTFNVFLLCAHYVCLSVLCAYVYGPCYRIQINES